jgi:multidrug efflux pump subunit AcrB
MRNLITFFATRHLLTNVIFFGMIMLGVFSWMNIGKEEMPEFESNWIRVTTVYPGAPAEDVELFVTKPLEDELKGVTGIDELVTTSSVGVSSLRITLDDDYPDKDEVVQEIKDAVLRANLPSEVRDLPKIRQFKSAAKAILDIGLYYKGHKFLTPEQRAELQKYVLSFENQLTAIPEVSAVDKDYYRKPELQILVNPEDKRDLEISLSEIRTQIQANNVRVPIGAMQDKGESKVTALNELEDVDSLKNLILRGNYEGLGIKLGEIAEIKNGFEKTTSIFKINGHEGVFLNVQKSVSTDILTAQAAVKKFIANFQKANKDSPLGIVMMDDESYDVVNRLEIITANGIMGFILIVLILLIFLNAKAGFWVAMGIPFSMSFTLLVAHMMGYTVNNMTLAGIIIVLGIVVDDAIIIAENIARKREEGLDFQAAGIEGTTEVIKPIFASIVTTCAAFVPLFFFHGFFGKLVSYIPGIVILMLVGSLIESYFVLPGHMSGHTPLLDKYDTVEKTDSWFHKIEKRYAKFLLKCFKFRIPVLIGFVLFLVSAAFVYNKEMKFVMFPREESQEIFIKVEAGKDATRFETAEYIQPIEDMFVSDTKNVVGVRSSIAVSRRGGAVKENEASILVELIPADDRPDPLRKLMKKWETATENLPGLEKVKFVKGRWGHSSGNSLELQIQENDDKNRAEIAEFLAEKMKAMPTVIDVEIDKPLEKNEFLFKILQDQLIKFNIAPSKVTTTLRAFVEGSILYSINKGEEEVDVRLSVPDKAKSKLEDLLKLKVENNQGQLVELKKIVEIKEVKRPINIQRTDYKRTTLIYANNKDATPLEVAEDMEQNIFPEIYSKYPTTILAWKGEVEDSRESGKEFLNSVYVVLILIYLILVVMFNSLGKPFVVLSIVPFGLAGVIFVLYLHGMSVYGFFAAIGALGMIGVVINDAIVMIDKIERTPGDSWTVMANVASTRLRPIVVTTLTTVVGILPTAYGVAGYDSMLAEMMLTMGWGLAFGTVITLVLLPCMYSFLGKPEEN